MAGVKSRPAFSIECEKLVFPTEPQTATTTTALSILDASVARFAPCSAIWFFDAHSSADSRDTTLFARLETSFRETLSKFPHWAGQLRWATEGDGTANPRTYGRPVVTYGGDKNIGVGWIEARYNVDLASIIPNREQRSTTHRIWMATDLPQELEAASKLAFCTLSEYEGLPCVAVQLTAFNCGGFSVNIKITHCLSDAHTLLMFMHTWAAQSRKAQLESSDPVFDSAMLDRHAGHIYSDQPDREIAARARALPMHRFDWWASEAPGYPGWAMASSMPTMPSPETLDKQQLTPSTHPPWLSWDMSLPVEHAQIHFSAAEVGRMKDAVMASLPSELSAQRTSRLDSLLSHVWMLINRARGHQSNDEIVYLNITLGLRTRLSPPLLETFIGSPLLLMYIAESGKDASTAPLGHIAAQICQTLTRFTPESVSAYLHDAAHEVNPQRLWQAFLGSNHTLVTSWTQLKAYEIQFGQTNTPRLARYVQGVMPRMDRLVQVMDFDKSGDFDISLGLEKETMQRVLKDPQLRAYA